MTVSDTFLRDALQTVIAGDDLDCDTARRVMDAFMDGSATHTQMGGFLTALRAKGESVDELTGMVESMREHCVRVDVDAGAVDTCGTGGDGLGTFNISTAAALVAAGAGCTVAKHGNRAASSRCGSADVLEALGVVIDLPPEGVTRCIDEAGIGFLYAPSYHPAMKHVGPVRRELGVRTVFNVLGPLANPAGVRHQAIGVPDSSLAPLMARVLQRLGHRHALVFSGAEGIDELGVNGVARVHEATPSAVHEFHVDPQDFGFTPAALSEVRGGDAAENARIVSDVLDGVPGAARDVVLLNAAAVLVAADAAADLAEGVASAARSIDSGDARQRLRKLVDASTRAAA